MSGRVRRPAPPRPGIATSTLIQSAAAALRIHSHESSRQTAAASAALQNETSIIAALATLVTTDARSRMG